MTEIQTQPQTEATPELASTAQVDEKQNGHTKNGAEEKSKNGNRFSLKRSQTEKSNGNDNRFSFKRSLNRSKTDLKEPSLPNTNKRALYRYHTMKRSFSALYNLTPEQMDAFMASYVIYGLDWANKEQMEETLGPNYSDKVRDSLINYYAVLNHLCALGEVEKMYIPPVMDPKKSIMQNQNLYEEMICTQLGLKEGMTVLDMGCGRGRVAAHMTKMSGAKVFGYNIDDDQLKNAKAYNEDQKLNNTFFKHDLNNLPMPFEDGSIDGFYQIQVMSLSKDLDALFADIYRMLKPGSRLAMLDWVSLDNYNPEDPHHLELMRRVKPLIGAIGTPTPAIFEAAIKKAGFNLLESRNASVQGHNQSLFIYRVKRWFNSLGFMIYSMVRMGALPQHFRTLLDRLNQDGDAFLEADKLNLVTTCYHLLAEKPKSAEGEPATQETKPAQAQATTSKVNDSEVDNNDEENPAKSINEDKNNESESKPSQLNDTNGFKNADQDVKNNTNGFTENSGTNGKLEATNGAAEAANGNVEATNGKSENANGYATETNGFSKGSEEQNGKINGHVENGHSNENGHTNENGNINSSVLAN